MFWCHMNLLDDVGRHAMGSRQSEMKSAHGVCSKKSNAIVPKVSKSVFVDKIDDT